MTKSTFITSFGLVVLYSLIVSLSEAQSVDTGTNNVKVTTTNTTKTERKLSHYEEIAVGLYKALGLVMSKELGLKIENETDVYMAKELLPTRKEWESAVNYTASKSSKHASGGSKVSDGAKTTNDTVLKVKEDIKPAVYNQSVQVANISIPKEDAIVTKESKVLNDTEIISVRGEVNQLKEDFKNLQTNLSIVSKKMNELGSELSKEVIDSIHSFSKMHENMKLGFGNQKTFLDFVTSMVSFSIKAKIDKTNLVVSAKLNDMDNDVKQIKEILSVLNQTLTSC